MHAFFGWGGEEEFSAGRILHRENFQWRGKFPGGEIFRGNFTLGKFVRIPIQFFFMSCFFFTNSIVGMEMLRVIVQGEFSPGLNCQEDISVRMEIFPWKWSRVSWRY
jgi:hypothetical protein